MRHFAICAALLACVTQAATFNGRTLWETRAEITIPESVAPNLGDSWTDYDEDIIQESYTLTISGGSGAGLLAFDIFAMGRISGQTISDVGSLISEANVVLPVSVFAPPYWPQGSSFAGCGSCKVEFVFGVPFTLQVWTYSRSGFSFTRTNADQVPLAGPVTSFTTIRMWDVLDSDAISVNGAVVNVEEISAQTPEPHTALTAIAAVIVLATLKRVQTVY